MQTGDTNYIYKNDLDKACFQHGMTYGKYKDLTKRTQLNKVLRDKAFEIAINLKYDGYQRGLASMDFNSFDKKSKGSSIKYMCKINNLQMNFINQLLENLKKEKYIFLLKTTFGMLTWLICN